jgi:hypothetical protein
VALLAWCQVTERRDAPPVRARRARPGGTRYSRTLLTCLGSLAELRIGRMGRGGRDGRGGGGGSGRGSATHTCTIGQVPPDHAPAPTGSLPFIHFTRREPGG